MKKGNKKKDVAAQFPEAYRFLWQAVEQFYNSDAAAENFLALPAARQRFYRSVEALRAAQPVEKRLMLSAFYKKFPAKKWAETQQIQHFLARLSAWRNTAVLDYLPSDLHDLIVPTRHAALWSIEDVEAFLKTETPAIDRQTLELLKEKLENPAHREKLDAFVARYPADFYYESRHLKMILAAIERL